MTELEAIKEVKERDAQRANVFCPLIKESCVTNCECYIEAYKISEISGNEQFWRVSGGYCTAYIFTGPTE